MRLPSAWIDYLFSPRVPICLFCGIFVAKLGNMISDKLFGNIIIFTAFILFGLNMPIAKYILSGHIQPEALTLSRMVSAALLFWIASFFSKYEPVPIKDLALLAICSLFGIMLNQGLFIYGLSLTSPVNAGIITTVGPIFVLVLSAIFLREPVTIKKVSGVILGITGALSLILNQNVVTTSSATLVGDIIVVCSCLAFSTYLIISRGILRRYSSVTIMKWMFLFAAIGMTPFLVGGFSDSYMFHHEGFDIKEWAAYLFVMVGATYLPYTFIAMAQKKIRPTTISMYTYVQPIIASVVAIVIGQDSFSLWKVGSALMVFTGVYFVTQSKSREDIEAKK